MRKLIPSWIALLRRSTKGERRRQALSIYATQLIDQVLGEGGEILLEPMSAADRKVIRDAVAEREDVWSYAEGEPPRRYVVIAPTETGETEDDTPEALNTDERGHVILDVSHRSKLRGHQGPQLSALLRSYLLLIVALTLVFSGIGFLVAEMRAAAYFGHVLGYSRPGKQPASSSR